MSSQILQGPKLKFPVNDKNLGRFFFDSADKHRDRICQIDGTIDKTETFGSVKLRSTRVAMELQKRGVTSSDVVVFCSSNTLDITIAIIATTYLGAKTANLECSLSVPHTKHLLSLVAPKVIFVEDSAVGLIEDSLTKTNIKTEIIVFGSSDKYSTFEDLVQRQDHEEEFKPVDVNSDDIAVMLFSSGSTGLPKAICHSHYSLLRATNQIYQMGMQEAFFHFSTFYWGTATLLLTCSFKAGSYRVFGRNLGAEDVFRIIQKHKVANIFTAPILTYKLTQFENASNYDTSSVKIILCGGTPMNLSQLDKMNKVFKSAKTTLCYGLTECGFVTSFDPDLDPEFMKTKMSSSGTPLPELQIKIVDTVTHELRDFNQKGEILIKSESLMKGYYQADASNVFDEDGFLKTGDIGYFDEDGYLYVVERIKEMFKYQSWHIVPSSIEAVLLEHPDVKETVVFGVPAGEDGEVPAACVVLREGSTVGKDDVEVFLESRVADREKLRGGVMFVDGLPRTSTGKVVRKEVRDFVINLRKNKGLRS